jgi:hypothetical protein
MSTIIDGTTGITTDGLIVGVEKAQLIRLETAQATTSGTSINFTGIPSWAKKITVILNEVSTNGTNRILLQIGSGSVETSGYVSSSGATVQAAVGSVYNSTAGIILNYDSAAQLISAAVTFYLIGSNLWVSTHVGKNSTTTNIGGGGSKTISGTLDRIRITTTTGVDTFDAGSVNILIEGSL